jgi:hypothetical protein
VPVALAVAHPHQALLEVEVEDPEPHHLHPPHPGGVQQLESGDKRTGTAAP